MGLMVGIPTFLCLALIWFPTIASVGLSFTNWQGYTGLDRQELHRPQELRDPVHGLPALLAGGLAQHPVAAGVRLHRDADRHLPRGPARPGDARDADLPERVLHPGRPVAGGRRASSGSSSTRSQGFINSVLGRTGQDNVIDWLGNPDLNIWAVLVAASWRHVGYVMVLYLAGLKSVDPTLREAAAIDGANARQTFFRVVFPVMRPINIVIIVITVIESLRAFDIVYIINQGKNGLELLSVLITNNSISEASLLGFGSAIAVVLLVVSLVPIVIFLDPHDAGGPDMTAAAAPTAVASAAVRHAARIRWQRFALHARSSSRLALVWLFPILWTLYTALRPYGDTAPRRLRLDRPHTLTFDNFSTAWDQCGMPKYFVNTLIIADPGGDRHAVGLVDARLRVLAVQLPAEPACC